MDLQCSARPGRACTVVTVCGEIDMDTGPQLGDFLHELLDGGARRVVLDFTDVGFMDSSGLGLLVLVFKRLRHDGGRLCLAAARKNVRTVLALSSVDQVVRVYDTVNAAEDDMPAPAA